MTKKTHIVGKTRPVLKEEDTVRSAKDIMRSARRAKSGIPDLKDGDKVRITLAGMQKHSRSTPASSGYSASTIAWREKLSKFRTDGTIGTVTKVFPNSDNVNVDFDGETFGVYDYMLELVPGDGMSESKTTKLRLMRLYEKFEAQVGQEYDMSRSERDAFLEAIRNYESYGNLIYRAEGISQAIDEIAQLVETANTFTLKETDGWFDNVTAGRHVKQMKEAVKVLQTESKEIMQRQQRLEAAYEDIGQLLGRYYNV